jgi:hypothetical protein
MPICASASFASPVPGAASAARRVKRCSAMSSVCCSKPDALAANCSSLQRLHAGPDLVGGLADRIRRRDGSIDQGSEAAHRGHSSERHVERPDTGAQQLRLAAEAFQPARGALARALDPLQALLAALADRNELGLDLSDTVDRQADGIGVRASGHRSVCVLRSGTCERGACRRSRGQTAVSGASSLRTSGQPGPMVRTSQVRPIAIQREKASNSEDRSLRNHYSQA